PGQRGDVARLRGRLPGRRRHRGVQPAGAGLPAGVPVQRGGPGHPRHHDGDRLGLLQLRAHGVVPGGRAGGRLPGPHHVLTVRPLPLLTPANEWFWTSGADGRLRVQGCQDCKALVHPPAPVCPVCRSRSWEPTVVSGRATVVAFTVNHHSWHPDFEAPYAIANVALAEDPTVRLTTNVVGCAPEDIHIGQEVMVRFEQHDDVWLPLFEPTGDTDPTDRVGEPALPAPRAPLSDERFEHRAVLSGVGRSAIGRRLMVDPLSLTVEACLAAIADAGLTPEDVH